MPNVLHGSYVPLWNAPITSQPGPLPLRCAHSLAIGQGCWVLCLSVIRYVSRGSILLRSAVISPGTMFPFLKRRFVCASMERSFLSIYAVRTSSPCKHLELHVDKKGFVIYGSSESHLMIQNCPNKNNNKLQKHNTRFAT